MAPSTSDPAPNHWRASLAPRQERRTLPPSDVVFHRDGTVTGTITAEGFGDPLAPSPVSTQVLVEGVWSLERLNAGSPPVLDLVDGSVATFDCESEVPSYSVAHGE